MAEDVSLKRQYGEWLATPKSERARLGLPRSQAKWAERYGIAPKTASRWKDDPIVQQTVARAEARQAHPAEPAEVQVQPTEGDHLDVLKTNLLNKALTGDEKSIEQFMKWFGKDELEAARRAAEAGMQQKTDEELVGEILDMIGVSAVQKWLEGQLASV